MRLGDGCITWLVIAKLDPHCIKVFIWLRRKLPSLLRVVAILMLVWYDVSVFPVVAENKVQEIVLTVCLNS